ncbi:MAG: DoxX family protein [Phototrophicaceae bacterium]|jgi:thiosulfate dehydrogenase [quinone] large subunit
MNIRQLKTTNGTLIEEPEIEKFLFNDVRMGIFWLILRVYLGYQWVTAGWHKVQDPGWVQTGDALKAFWERIVVIPETGRPAITFGWYRDFIQFMLDTGSYTWFAKLVAYGEVLIGVALILGAFVGVAAFFGAFLNWNFIMAGSASTNGLLGLAAIFLILAWKTAGYYGLDRFLLPYIGTPYTRFKEIRAGAAKPEKAPQS